MEAPNRIFWIVAGSTMLAYLVGSFWLDSYRVPRWYRTFRQARLRGVIRSRYAGKGPVSLNLLNDPQTYYFFPCDSSGQPQNNKFVTFAAPGDSVRKASGSDTLYLLKNKRVYFFIAEKPR